MANSYNGDLAYSTNPFLNTNPFLMDLDPPAPEQSVQPGTGEQLTGDSGSGRFRLPEFWPHAPGIWFARAELRFEISGIASERLRFGHTVDALPYESLCLVADLVEHLPAVEPYRILKERLLMAHQLSPVQKAVKLMDSPALGDRRPSQLLADLLQLCPAGEQSTAFFRGSFMKRLPSEIQVHLSQCETTNLKELAQRADQLWLSHSRPAVLAPVAAAESGQEELLCAAVSTKAANKAASGKKADA
jgi:hypothetical protein